MSQTTSNVNGDCSNEEEEFFDVKESNSHHGLAHQTSSSSSSNNSSLSSSRSSSKQTSPHHHHHHQESNNHPNSIQSSQHSTSESFNPFDAGDEDHISHSHHLNDHEVNISITTPPFILAPISERESPFMERTVGIQSQRHQQSEPPSIHLETTPINVSSTTPFMYHHSNTFDGNAHHPSSSLASLSQPTNNPFCLDSSPPSLSPRVSNSACGTPLSRTWPAKSNLSEDKASAARALATAEQTISNRFGADAVEDPILKSASRSPRCQQPPIGNNNPFMNASSSISGMTASSALLNGGGTTATDLPQFEHADYDELIQFKNLDTGEVRLLPLELVSAAANSSKASKNSNNHRGGKVEDNFFDIFNANSETYQKLQRHLERLAERRRRRAQKKSQNGEDDYDDESSEEDEDNSSDDDDDDLDGHTRNASQPGGLWTRTAPAIRAFFTRSKPPPVTTPRSSSLGVAHPANQQRSPNQNGHQVSDTPYSQDSVDSITATTQKQHPTSRLSRFIHRRQEPANGLPVVSNTLQPLDDPSSSSIAPTPFAKSSTSTFSTSSEATGQDAATAAANATGKFQPSQWLRRSSSALRQLPYLIPSRITSNKEQQCLSQMWLVKELVSPEESGPIWSLAISGDGRWIAAGVQSGAIHLWQIRTKSTAPIPTSTTMHDCHHHNSSSASSDHSSPLMMSYETVDLSSPQSRNQRNNNNTITAEQLSISHTRNTSTSPTAPHNNNNSDDNSKFDSSSASSSSSNHHQQQQTHNNYVFNNDPDVTLTGHSATIVICRWDFKPLPNGVNRLASASLDRSVRVWSIESTPTQADGSTEKRRYQSIVCYCADWCTGVCFHPTFKDLLYTSALDGTIQVWRIPIQQQQQPHGIIASSHKNIGEGFEEGFGGGNGGRDPSVLHQWPPTTTTTMASTNHPRSKRVEMLEFTRMSELVTAMAISPDGSLLGVGLRFGRVAFYESRTLRFRAEVECRNRKGRYANGRKVTGLVWAADSQSICVSTSDSRIRVITLSDISNWLKFKGHVTKQMMLYAQYSPSEQHLICGSESSWIFLWNINPPSMMNSLVSSRLTMGRKKKPTNSQVEKFKAFDELLTSCLVAPDAFSARLVDAIARVRSSSGEGSSSNCPSAWESLQISLNVGPTSTPSTTLSSEKPSIALSSPILPSSSPCSSNGLSLNRLVIVAGSFKGTIRIFINTKHPIHLK